MAYQCDDSGAAQAIRFAFPRSRRTSSCDQLQCCLSKWRGDGKEIYILNINTGYLVAVSVSDERETKFSLVSSQNLFQYPFAAVGNFVYVRCRRWQEILARHRAAITKRSVLAGRPNWPAELKKK